MHDVARIDSRSCCNEGLGDYLAAEQTAPGVAGTFAYVGVRSPPVEVHHLLEVHRAGQARSDRKSGRGMRQSFVATWLGVTCIAGSNRAASTCDGVGAKARVSSALHEVQGPQNRSETAMLHLGQSKRSEASDPAIGCVIVAVGYR